MSVHDRTFTVVLPHPWRRLSESALISLRWHDGGQRGWCRHSTQEVSLRRNLSQAERRSALLHELVHLERGPAVIGHRDRDERETRRDAARWLIPLKDLGRALVWAQDDHELADELWVDVFTVRARLSGLTDAETAELNRMVDAAERCFPG